MTRPAPTPEQRELLDALFDKWSLLVLDELCIGPRRFAELRRGIIPITAKSLTETLRRLERNGLVARHVHATAPVSVSYDITALGRTLEAPLGAVLDWTATHLREVHDERARFDDALDARP